MPNPSLLLLVLAASALAGCDAPEPEPPARPTRQAPCHGVDFKCIAECVDEACVARCSSAACVACWERVPACEAGECVRGTEITYAGLCVPGAWAFDFEARFWKKSFSTPAPFARRVAAAAAKLSPDEVGQGRVCSLDKALVLVRPGQPPVRLGGTPVGFSGCFETTLSDDGESVGIVAHGHHFWAASFDIPKRWPTCAFHGYPEAALAVRPGAWLAPDGRTLVIKTQRLLRVQQLAERQAFAFLQDTVAAIESVSFSPSGRWLVLRENASGSTAPRVMFIDVHASAPALTSRELLAESLRFDGDNFVILQPPGGAAPVRLPLDPASPTGGEAR